MPLNNLSVDAMVIKIQKQLPVNVITPNFVQRLEEASMYNNDQLMKIVYGYFYDKTSKDDMISMTL